MFVFRFLLCCCVVSIAASEAMAESLLLFYADGRVIVADVATKSLEWTHVSDAGVSTVKTIRLSDIRELVLAKSPAAKQIAEIRKLITELDSPEYRVRQEAEDKLSQPELSAPFVELILEHVEDPRVEVQFRLERILERLKQKRVQSNLMFDTLVLKNGESMQGDAGDFQWSGVFLERAIEVRRGELTSVEPGSAATKIDSAVSADNVSVKLFHDHEDFAADKSLRVVDFSSDPGGNLMGRNDDVSNTFIPWGLKFDDSGKGYVGIPFYNVKEPKPPQVESEMIAKFNRKPGLNGMPFKGEINFEFCMPNQPLVPAGVHRFGTFIATVDSTRSFILEAFDREGGLIGTVEAEKANRRVSNCGFLGIESTTPIHRIQVRSNPYLYRVDANVDEDYGLDTFYFSKPVPIALPVDEAMQGVVLRDGTRLLGRVSLNAPNQVSVATDDFGELKFKLNDVGEIGFGKTLDRQLKTWMATLVDGSTLVVDPLRGFKSSLLQRSVESSLLCLYNSSTPKRYPVEGDFQQGKNVLVYPTCRIPTAKVDFTSSGFAWPKDAIKLLQPVDEESPLGVPGKDPTPQVSKIDYQTTTAENLPTLWLGKPKPLTRGFVRLTDGQTLSLGNNRKIISMSGGNLQFQETGNADAKLMISIDRVAVIDFGE